MVIELVNIVRAEVKDLQLVWDLSHLTFIETYRGTCSDEDLQHFLDKCFSEDAILQELKDTKDFYFIAFADGFPAGYMRLKEDYADYPDITKYNALELKRIYVLKEYHRHKIGAGLMQFAMQLALEKKFEAVWLGVWEENPRAIRFYKKNGFVEFDKHIFKLGADEQTDIMMKLKLSN